MHEMNRNARHLGIDDETGRAPAISGPGRGPGRVRAARRRIAPGLGRAAVLASFLLTLEACGLFTAAALVGGAALPGLSRAASVEEDDEESLGGDPGFTVPADIADAKRKAAEVEGLSVLLGASAFWGKDANVYRSPGEVEKSSDARGNWGYLRADRRWGSGDRLLSTATWRQMQFPGHSHVNANHGKLSNWYSRPLGRSVGLELDLDASRKSDDAATILGSKYSRKYGYWRFASEGALSYEPPGRHRFRLSGEAVRKNYDETPGHTSIDWTQWTALATYRLQIGAAHAAGISYALGERSYDEELAAQRTGDELPTNPTEHHRYRDLAVTLGGPLVRRVSLELKYERISKQELFDGYESRSAHGGQASLGFRATDRLELRVDGGQAWRTYERIEGDGGRPLSYTTAEAGVGGAFRVSTAVRLFGGFTYYERVTNKSSGSTYRSYHGSVTRMGLGVFL